jgi:hypothetical protein
MTVDPREEVHISYYDQTNGDLKYAHRCPFPADITAAVGPVRGVTKLKWGTSTRHPVSR